MPLRLFGRLSPVVLTATAWAVGASPAFAAPGGQASLTPAQCAQVAPSLRQLQSVLYNCNAVVSQVGRASVPPTHRVHAVLVPRNLRGDGRDAIHRA